MIELPKHHQVFVPGEVLIDGSILASQANMRTERVGVFDDIEPGHLCSTGVGTQERRQDTHGGGLASAIRAEQGEDAPLLSDQIEPCQGMRFSIMFVESFGQYGRSVRHGRFLLFQAATDSICYCLVIHRHN